jgi:hypothetical protein
VWTKRKRFVLLLVLLTHWCLPTLTLSCFSCLRQAGPPCFSEEMRKLYLDKMAGKNSAAQKSGQASETTAAAEASTLETNKEGSESPRAKKKKRKKKGEGVSADWADRGISSANFHNCSSILFIQGFLGGRENCQSEAGNRWHSHV